MQPAIAGCFFTGKFGQTPSRTENSQSVSQEKRIADLATDIKKSGLTTRKATIAAQTLYQTAQQYGPNAEAMLAAYEPGQDPKRFASGFQNAYILGTQGNQEALGRSKAAAYLTQEQRLTAYGLGKTIYSDRISSEETPENKKYDLSADGRDKLDSISIRAVARIAQGFSAFPVDDPLHERSKRVKPDGNKFDVAMHGSPTMVAFGSREANMSPRLLAKFIMHSEGYHGQEIRLLACSTGCVINGEYCFAEELANALGVTVWAPNDLLFFRENGTIYVGADGSGSIVPIQPNERGRIK